MKKKILGPYYLTRLLLDLLKQSAPSRIINVSSEGHRSNFHFLSMIFQQYLLRIYIQTKNIQGSKMNWEDLQNEKNFSGFGCYAQSKLGNILFTVELAKRLKGFLNKNYFKKLF